MHSLGADLDSVYLEMGQTLGWHFRIPRAIDWEHNQRAP